MSFFNPMPPGPNRTKWIAGMFGVILFGFVGCAYYMGCQSC
jgi:hypothetical protein